MENINRSQRIRRGIPALAALATAGALSGCPLTTPINGGASGTATTSTAVTIPATAKAVRIMMNSSPTTGSFDATQTPSGTAAIAKQGNYATRLFDPNNGSTLLATFGSTSWPSWLTRFEIGVSGANNTGAPTANCANFAVSPEDTAKTCNFGAGAGSVACGAPVGQFRVSEYDCMNNGTTSRGNGGDTDPIYIRAYFSRNSYDLAPSENILAVVQYSASAYRPGPTTPVTCLTGGNFTPESPGCSDFVWQSFIRIDGGPSPVQPFMMMIPPFSGSVNTTLQTSGSGIMTKQFLLPLSTNPTANVFQLSRTGSNIPGTSDAVNYPAFSNLCGTNSPLCAGIVFYAVSLYRI